MLVLNYLTFVTVAVAQYGFHYGHGRGGHFPKGNPSPPQLPSLTKTAMCVRRLRTFTCRRKISLKIGKVPTSIFKKHKPQYQPKPNEIPDSSKKSTSTPNPNPYPNNPFLPKKPNEIPDSSKKSTSTPNPNPYPNNPFLPKKPNEIPDSSKKSTSTPNPNPYPNNPFLPKKPNEIPDSSKKSTSTPNPNPYPNNPFLPKKPNEIPDSSKKPNPNPYPNNPFLPKKPIYNDQPTPNPDPYPNNPFLPKKPIYNDQPTPNPNPYPNNPFLPKKPIYNDQPTPNPDPYPNNPFLPKKPIYNDQPTPKQPTPKKPIYDQGKEDTNDNSCHKGNFTTKANFQILMNSQADRNVIPAGQCTEWVDGRYYELTGQHVTFSGKASDWAKQAYTQGNIWDVSSVPKVPSIVVMSKGAQGASLSTGHVAIVESASGSSICTSNWNSPHLGKTTYKVIQPGNGIYFLTLKPGAKIENSLKPHISVY
ncbi:hypothetical protein DSO57_1024974 [Entomophthora muscae]|uniref:Uncharacterized protein n=1 Tax=Entomophthora muscae TaxID=34485 RepID=A0ACC2TQB3_9FUNG|nr:hypothetical protein DSO57_1024974 [Entomophthora muscae]